MKNPHSVMDAEDEQLIAESGLRKPASKPGYASDEQPKTIRRSAMDLLARREHSALELMQKLARRFSSREHIESVISQLAEEGLQSDLRFAESYLCYRSQRGQGPVRLRQELAARGVGDSEINAAFVECDVDWHQLAEQIYRKKYSDSRPEDAKDRARRIRFMLYRGFGHDQFESLI